MAGKNSKPAPGKIYRNADNGQFVTKRYVKTHPKTTVTETEPRRKSK